MFIRDGLSLIETWKWIFQAELVCAYGIYSTRFEMLCLHFWYLIYGFILQIVCPYKYNSLEAEIEDKFKDILREKWESEIVSRGNVVVTHSCRTIFYCIIKTLLHQNGGKLKIATNSVHFGSFYRILKQINSSDDYDIDFYEIDLNLDDWTLNTSSINEEEFKSCDMVLCMHLFGVPLDQDILFELGHKFGIPVIEDCVQSGSLFSNYKGHSLADVSFWSGGLDKTPSCFGGGFGFFKDTEHGNGLYERVEEMICDFRFDSWSRRLVSLFNQTIHLMICKNYFWSIAWFQCVFCEKWHELSLRVRKTKAITPFQHQSAVFLRKPSLYQLLSIRYGISKDYSLFAEQEITKRDVFLKCVPAQYHKVLFPWMTPKVVERMRENKGICEFSWVFTSNGDRIGINDFLCDRRFITMINTTWCHHDASTLKDNNGQRICDNLTYLPNLNELNHEQIVGLAKVLTEYCREHKL